MSQDAYISRLEALVRWLALPYGDVEPLFAGADGQGTIDGRPLPHAAELADTYRSVVGSHLKPASEGDIWVQCERCRHWARTAAVYDRQGALS